MYMEMKDIPGEELCAFLQSGSILVSVASPTQLPAHSEPAGERVQFSQ